MGDVLRIALRVLRKHLGDDLARAIVHEITDALLDEAHETPRSPARRAPVRVAMPADADALTVASARRHAERLLGGSGR